MTDIENFVSTSSCRTIMEAADRLGMTQPAYTDKICLLHRPEFGSNKAEALVSKAIKLAINGAVF